MIALSRVEKEVVEYVARGYENHEIAEARGCSINTVRNTIVRIQDKLSARNRTQIAVKALVHRLVDIQEVALV